MAINTVDASWFFHFLPKHIAPGMRYMRHDMPSNVSRIETMYIVHNDATRVRWKNKDGSTHDMEFLHPLVPEYITALLVSMRLSC